ncbi:isoprenoid synthase domain-containing protein [Irpex rosettiformis]|uniref:Isoprenoid synthase domain-containing protein n=1 Tax=Irpex rosettiformis TaxID=378272 RepID=A0ACB8U610_9APHY|nr:isoprenoid synthase domain-containing protein [Irpex rosettiformis]
MAEEMNTQTSTTELTKGHPYPEMLYLPETVRDWPWTRMINPYYEEVAHESSVWLKPFKPFKKQSQYAFDLCDFGRLAALVYPHASREHLRAGVDLMNVYFVIDEYTDVEPQQVVREMIEVIIDAIHNPTKPRPKGEVVLGEITRQFWDRAKKTATPEAVQRFVDSFKDYLDAVVIQAGDRDQDRICTVDEYFEARSNNIGSRPCYAISELHLSIPDYVFYHPVIKELELLITYLIILDNDMASYNREQATGDDHYNIITIVMRQFNLSLPNAFNWAARYHDEIKTKFLDGLKKVPSWGKELDDQVAMYIDHLARWPRGSDCWNFESGRYFGSKGLEIQKTRYVPLYPKRKRVTHLHKEDIDIPIVDCL